MSDKLSRHEIIQEIQAIVKPEKYKDTLTWQTLCKFTEFDSFATALAYGLKWQDTNMLTMPIGNLTMALFNMKVFPKIEACKEREQ